MQSCMKLLPLTFEVNTKENRAKSPLPHLSVTVMRYKNSRQLLIDCLNVFFVLS